MPPSKTTSRCDNDPGLKEIAEPHFLVVEGPDDQRFFKALLRRSQISGFQVDYVAGVSNLPDFLEASKIRSGFENVTSIGIVRDANGNRDGAFQSVHDALKAAGFPVPSKPLVLADGQPRVSVMIMPPDEDKAGRMLEDLCLEAVTDDPAMHCVEEYFRCLEDQNVVQKEGARPKARLHAFLASRERPGLRLGEAAEKNDIPLDNPVFEPVTKFLRQLAS